MHSSSYKYYRTIFQSCLVNIYLNGLYFGLGNIYSLMHGYFYEKDSIFLTEVIVRRAIFLLSKEYTIVSSLKYVFLLQRWAYSLT